MPGSLDLILYKVCPPVLIILPFCCVEWEGLYFFYLLLFSYELRHPNLTALCIERGCCRWAPSHVDWEMLEVVTGVPGDVNSSVQHNPPLDCTVQKELFLVSCKVYLWRCMSAPSRWAEHFALKVFLGFRANLHLHFLCSERKVVLPVFAFPAWVDSVLGGLFFWPSSVV